MRLAPEAFEFAVKSEIKENKEHRPYRIQAEEDGSFVRAFNRALSEVSLESIKPQGDIEEHEVGQKT